MDRSIALFVSLSFVLVGLSHAVQPGAWVEFFRVLKRTGVAGLIIAMFTLPMGLLIVVGHNRWAWSPAVLVTLIGWGMTFKGTLYMLRPSTADRMLARLERPRGALGDFRVVGIGMAALGGFLAWQAVAGGLTTA